MAEQWDVFLSYASEDHDQVTGPLNTTLTALGLKVWFDRTELKIGDSLRERIDDGLARCRFGIVVLSPAFFRKHYPQRELNGLAQREVSGAKVILPVWYQVNAETVRQYSPPLADRVGAQVSDGIETVAVSLFLTIRPDIIKDAETAAKQIRPLSELLSGRQVFEVMADAHAHNFVADDVADAGEAELIGGFQTWIREIADFAEDMDPTQILETHLELTSELARLHDAGWRVFGERRRKKVKFETEDSTWTIPVIAVLKGARAAATAPGGKIIAIRRDDPVAETRRD